MHWGDQVPSPGTFWGALCFTLNYGHFPNSTPVSEHFNQVDHSKNQRRPSYSAGPNPHQP